MKKTSVNTTFGIFITVILTEYHWESLFFTEYLLGPPLMQPIFYQHPAETEGLICSSLHCQFLSGNKELNGPAWSAHIDSPVILANSWTENSWSCRLHSHHSSLISYWKNPQCVILTNYYLTYLKTYSAIQRL